MLALGMHNREESAGFRRKHARFATHGASIFVKYRAQV